MRRTPCPGIVLLLSIALLSAGEKTTQAQQKPAPIKASAIQILRAVAGATSIKVHAQFVTRNGQTLLERDIEGKVRFFGENLRATYNLSKAVAKVVRENF